MNTNQPVECGGTPEQTTNRLPPELTSFAARKEARARELAAQLGAELPPVVWAFLTAAKQGERFWSERFTQMLGDWLRPETPVSEVCAFADRVYLRKELAGFTGDPSYVANELARRTFSKLRSAIAGLFEWRAQADSDPAGRRRMAEAADFAFRQAFALDPHSPEAVFRFASHFLTEHRSADALLVAETAAKLSPENSQVQSLAQYLARLARKDRTGTALKSSYGTMVNRGLTPNRRAG